MILLTFYNTGNRQKRFQIALHVLLSRDSSVAIETGCGLDGRDSNLGRGKIFLFSTTPRPALRPTQPLIQWVPGALSPEVKRPGRKADHSPPSNAEVKNTWIYTSTPPYAFMALCLMN
jgi:hypothetical protein